MSCESLLTVIRGDGFSHLCHYSDAENKPIDLAMTEFEAVIENANYSWLEILTVKKLDQTTNPGGFLIQAESTMHWQIGELQIKLTRIVDGYRKSILIPVTVVRG